MEKITNEQELLSQYTQILPLLKDEFKLQEKVKSDPQFLFQLLNIEQDIRNLALFSPNEEFKEITINHIEFLNLPYYIGLTCQKMLIDRLKYIKQSEIYFKIYLSLLDHYQVLPKLVSKTFSEIKENNKKLIEREEKINLYKLEKEIKEKLEQEKNDEKKFNFNKIQLTSILCLNKMLMIPQELQILEFQEKMNKDPNLKEQYEKDQQQYSPAQIKFFKLEKPKPSSSEIIQKYLFERGIELPEEIKKEQQEDSQLKPNFGQQIVQNFQNIPKTHLTQREEMQQKLWQHSYAQPKMTLEEHSELEYILMKDKQQKQQEFEKSKKQELQKMGIEDENDSDNEKVSDFKQEKDRHWDDWKDLHDKGEGNRNHR